MLQHHGESCFTAHGWVKMQDGTAGVSREDPEKGWMRRYRPWPCPEGVFHIAKRVSSLWAEPRGKVVLKEKRCLRGCGYGPLCPGGDQEL